MSRFPDWDSFEITAGITDGPVAFCGDLSPASVLGAYRRGLVPFPADGEYLRDLAEFRYEDEVAEGLIGLVGDADPYWVSWWSPDPRPVIAADGVHLGRNVRKQLRRNELWTTSGRSFARVAQECRAGREPRWLTDTLLETMIELHREGWAHSIEVWQDDDLTDLIGGAIGVAFGRTFSGDSLFSLRPDAARIAVADLGSRFAQAGGELIDAQWGSPLLRSLGALPVPRDRYLRLLAVPAPRDPVPLPAQPLSARRLIEPRQSR